MPRYMLEIPLVHESVTRPIIRHVTKEVLENFGLVDKNVKMVFNGMNDTIPINNSTLENTNNPIRLDSDSRIEVDFDEEVVNPLEVAIMRSEQRFIFLDPELRVWLRPIYVSNKLTITFTLICKDKSTATMWKRRAELQSYRGMNQFMIDADYHYNIPAGFIKQLWVIHALRENSADPRTETFGKWLKRCFVDNFTSISNQAYKNTSFAIKEMQTRIQAYFNFGYEVSEIERKNEAGAWQAQFSVELYYDRPDGIVMTYPLMVHNQLMPPDYRDDTPADKAPIDYLSSRSLSLQDFGLFERINAGSNPITRYSSAVVMPKFDDWMHEWQLPKHACMTRILLSLVPDDPRWIFTFDEESLGDYKITDKVIAYMKDCGNMLLKPYDSIFNITVHEWYDLVSYKNLNIDENLKLTSTVDLSFKNMYHVVVCLLCDLSYLSEEGWEKLEKHPGLIEDWISVIRPDLDIDTIPRNPDGSIDKDVVIDVGSGGSGNGGNHTDITVIVDGKEYNRRLVNQFSIFTMRRQEDATRY